MASPLDSERAAINDAKLIGTLERWESQGRRFVKWNKYKQHPAGMWMPTTRLLGPHEGVVLEISAPKKGEGGALFLQLDLHAKDKSFLAGQGESVLEHKIWDHFPKIETELSNSRASGDVKPEASSPKILASLLEQLGQHCQKFCMIAHWTRSANKTMNSMSFQDCTWKLLCCGHSVSGILLEKFKVDTTKGAEILEDDDDKTGPAYWGVTVGQIAKVWTEAKEDLERFCDCHAMVEVAKSKFRKVCKAWPCPYHDQPLESSRASLQPLIPNMHLLVERWIKPKTEKGGPSSMGCSYATLLNEKTGLLKATVFISHCWDDHFGNFSATLSRNLKREDAVVWVCSFALNQHANISAVLGSDVKASPLHASPFARALKSCEKFAMVLDENATPLTRSWCVYELHLARSKGKDLDFWVHSWPNVLEALSQRRQQLDVRQCEASNEEDHARIMEAIKGSEDTLNEQVGAWIDTWYQKVRDIRDQTTSGAAPTPTHPCPHPWVLLLKDKPRGVVAKT